MGRAGNDPRRRLGRCAAVTLVTDDDEDGGSDLHGGARERVRARDAADGAGHDCGIPRSDGFLHRAVAGVAVAGSAVDPGLALWPEAYGK